MVTFLLYAVLALAAVIYYFINKSNKRFNYFKDRGIPQLPTEFFFGNERNVVLEKQSGRESSNEIYRKFKKMGVKHGGVYTLNGRKWMPVDPDLIKTILIKDFQNFSTHYGGRHPGLFFNNIFHMDGEEWKDMRRKLTPTFTSGKMKMMFELIAEKTKILSDLVGEMSETGEPAEMKALLVRFTTDVIGTCGFGIECNSMTDKNSEFYIQSQSMFQDPNKAKKSQLSNLLNLLLIWVGVRKFKIPDFKPLEDFFREVVRKTLKLREERKIIRKDFLHLMIQLKNKGVITELVDDTDDIYEKTVRKEVMTFEDIAGQCLLFFVAGFETSSTTMSNALLELTQNQDVQQKLREEVREVLERHDGKLTYEALQEMTYCEGVIYEALRKYPPLPSLPRVCTKTYTIPGTDSVIEKGTPLDIPVWALQMDPDYFPEPEKFIPERFFPENKSKIRDMTYLPFGEGPRMCLGLRFGMMQSKAGIAALVKNYNFTLNKKTSYPLKFNNGSIWINASKAD